MKKVDYGFDMADEPIGMFEGIGISSEPVGAIAGEFLGVVSLKGEDYLIGRTTIAFKDDPEYLGKITARRATAKKYEDGSGIIFLDMEESKETKAIEEIFSARNVTEESLRSLANPEYDSLIDRDEIMATAIRHDVFEKKKMTSELDKKISEIVNKTY